MSHKQRSSVATWRARQRPRAPVFAALGDETRLTLVAKLSSGQPYSISQLTRGSRLTRQAITKHLRVLQNVGIVPNRRRGHDSRLQFNPQPPRVINEQSDS